MEEREHEREKELDRKRRADHPGGNDRDHRPGKKDRRESGTSDVEGWVIAVFSTWILNVLVA